MTKLKHWRRMPSWRQICVYMLLTGFIAIALGGCDGGDDDEGVAGPQGPRGPEGPTGPPGPPGPVADDLGNMQLSIDSAQVEQGELQIDFYVGDSQGRPYNGLQDGDLGATFAKLTPRARYGDGHDWQNYILNTEAHGDSGGLYGDAFTAEREGADLVSHGDGEYTLSYQLFENGEVTYEENVDLSGLYDSIDGGAVDRGDYQGEDLFWWKDGTALPHGVTLTDNSVTVEYDPDLTHRVALEMQADSMRGANASYDFIPATGEKVVDPSQHTTRNIVDVESCNSCHDQLSEHGGIRVDTHNCVTCHNPGNVKSNGRSVDFKQLVHRIHRGEDLPSVAEFGESTDLDEDWLTLSFPQGIADEHNGIDNCVKCHQGQDSRDALVDMAGGGDEGEEIIDSMQLANVTSDGDLWQQRSVEACSSCHDDTSWWSGAASIETTLAEVNNSPPGWDGFRQDHPGGQEPGTWLGCASGGCHTGDITSNPTAQIGTGGQPVHQGHLMLTRTVVRSELLEPEFSNLDYDTSTGELSFEFRIRDAANDGYITLTNREEEDASNDKLSFLIGWIEDGYSDYTHSTQPTGEAYTFAPDWSNQSPGSDGWYELSVDLVGEIDVLDNAGELDNSTIAISTQGAAEGSAWADEPENQYPQNVRASLAVGDDAPVEERREVVDFKQTCRSCHQRLGHHGGNKRNDPVTCTMCHTPNKTDVSYFGPWLAPDNDPRLGNEGAFDSKYEESIDFKRIIHVVHSSYKREDGVQLRQNVFGGALAGESHDSHWPAQRGNCHQCHVNESYELPLTEDVIGSTLFTFNWDNPVTGNVGSTAFLTDNSTWDISQHKKMSPTVSVCSSCHDSGSAEDHIASMGGTQFDALTYGFADATWGGIDDLDPNTETCQTCHGPGRIADIEQVHDLSSQ